LETLDSLTLRTVVVVVVVVSWSERQQTFQPTKFPKCVRWMIHSPYAPPPLDPPG